MTLNLSTQPTFWVEICMAGDLAVARQTCREFTRDVGLCVTLRAEDFIYTNGLESGFVVRLINYPRFPSTPSAITERAVDLGRVLLDRCCQKSFLIQNPEETRWYHLEPVST